MKAIKRFGLCYIVACLFISCFSRSSNSSSSSNSNGTLSVTGENGQVYESYQECCAAEDFTAAHLFLAKIKNSEDRNDEYNEAKEYIFKNEALYLMGMGDDKAKKRLIYLLKEEDDESDHVSMLIDLAIENDDEEFVKTLSNQYDSSVSERSLRKLMDYLLAKPNNDNKEFINQLLHRVEADDILFEIALEKGDKQYIREYISKHLYLGNKTLLNYLAGSKNKDYSEMILGLLAAEEKNIPTKPALGMIQSDYNGELDGSYESYKSSVNEYNDACKLLLQIAISSKNQYLAQRVVNFAKPNITSKKVGSWRIVEKSYNGTSLKAIKVSLDNTEINSIKAAYQEAVRSGAFK